MMFDLIVLVKLYCKKQEGLFIIVIIIMFGFNLNYY